ncbi:MAG TPA: nucleotidyltransferase family protein [Gemmatimonadaceae bacterium]
MIAGILLASGASTRFGGDKLLAALDGRPVVRWSAEALAGAVDTLVVIVREDGSAIRRALEGLPIRWAINHDAERGMSTAIRAGIAALPAQVAAAIIALADQPLVDAGVVERLVARWREGGARAVQPRYDDGRGHPVLFDGSLFPALTALEGDVGARAVLDSVGDELDMLTVAGPGPIDVDTPEALRAVAAELARRGRA